ncbi:hypothetical protein [Halococcus thailandensis]|nr:hypothetical protein [Halococcus thailandensis]
MVDPDSPIPLEDLNDVGIKHYSFPAPRLRRGDPETDDFEALEDLDDIDSNGTDDESESESVDATATDQDAGTAEAEDTADGQDQELQQQEQELEHELEQLSEFLRDNGVRSEVDGSVVVAEKLGQSYEITPDGEVNGDGAFQDRLEQLASKYSS